MPYQTCLVALLARDDLLYGRHSLNTIEIDTVQCSQRRPRIRPMHLFPVLVCRRTVVCVFSICTFQNMALSVFFRSVIQVLPISGFVNICMLELSLRLEYRYYCNFYFQQHYCIHERDISSVAYYFAACTNCFMSPKFLFAQVGFRAVENFYQQQ